jgi:hypothetical protein
MRPPEVIIKRVVDARMRKDQTGRSKVHGESPRSQIQTCRPRGVQPYKTVQKWAAADRMHADQMVQHLLEAVMIPFRPPRSHRGWGPETKMGFSC